MNDQVDQFGRDKSKNLNDNISNDRSKKILESSQDASRKQKIPQIC